MTYFVPPIVIPVLIIVAIIAYGTYRHTSGLVVQAGASPAVSDLLPSKELPK